MEEQVVCKTRLKERAEQYLNEQAQEIYKMVGMEFDINSHQQLATVLYDELKIGDEICLRKRTTLKKNPLIIALWKL